MNDKILCDLTPERFGNFYEKNKEKKLSEIFDVKAELISGRFSDIDFRSARGATATACCRIRQCFFGENSGTVFPVDVLLGVTLGDFARRSYFGEDIITSFLTGIYWLLAERIKEREGGDNVRKYILDIGDKTEYCKREGDRFFYKTEEMTEYSKPVSAKKLVGIMRAADNYEQNTEPTDDMADKIIAAYPHLEKFRNVIIRRFYLRPTILLLTALGAGDTKTADLIIEDGYHLGKEQLEAMRITDAEIKCVGKSNGRWVFRVKQENKAAAIFTHEKGEDIVFNAKTTRLVSPELCRKIDKEQEKAEKYVSDAFDEKDGFFRIVGGLFVVCVREAKKLPVFGTKDYIEICFSDDSKRNDNASWCIAEVEDFMENKANDSFFILEELEEISDGIPPETAKKILSVLPTLDRKKLAAISRIDAGLILYANKIGNRRMMLKVLYMTGLATREECDELTAQDGKMRFIQTHELYTPETLRVEKIRKRNVYGSFFRGRYYGYEMTVVIDGRSYPARIYTDGLRMRFYLQIRLYSDHKVFKLQLDEAAREKIKKACVEFDKKEENK